MKTSESHQGNPRRRLERIEDLTPDELNVNLGTERGQLAIDWSITELGAGRSIVADADGVILAGNKTHEAALAHGLPIHVVETTGDALVVVQRTDLRLNGEGAERARARKLAVADNRTHQLSYHEDAQTLIQHQLSGIDLEPLYSAGELALLRQSITPFDAANGARSFQTPEENLSRFHGEGVKQLVFYVDFAQYEDVVKRLDDQASLLRLETHSDVLLALLGVIDVNIDGQADENDSVAEQD